MTLTQATAPNFPVDQDQSSNCNAKALDWALLVLTIITTHVAWWAIHIPTIFREGFRGFIEDVAWECLRVHQPGYIGLVCCQISRRDEWQAKYYTGRTKVLSNFQKHVKPIVVDTLLIATSILSIYRLCVGLRHGQHLSGLNSSLWAYPSSPVALTGLWIIVASRTQMRVRFVLLGQVLITGLVGTGMALAIHFNDFDHTNVWYPATLVYIGMGMPIALIDPRIAFLFIFLAAIARGAGPILGATSLRPKNAYFPFCALRGARFAGPLIAFMILAGVFAFYAMEQTWSELNRNTAERLRRQRENRNNRNRNNRNHNNRNHNNRNNRNNRNNHNNHNNRSNVTQII